MESRRSAPDIPGMSPSAAPMSLPSAFVPTMRVCLDEDPVDLQRRLEAFLLIAQRVWPAGLPSAA